MIGLKYLTHSRIHSLILSHIYSPSQQLIDSHSDSLTHSLTLALSFYVIAYCRYVLLMGAYVSPFFFMVTYVYVCLYLLAYVCL